MVERVYPTQRRKRSGERFAPLEAFREQEQLLGVRHLGLLEIRVGFQPELCHQRFSPNVRSLVSMACSGVVYRRLWDNFPPIYAYMHLFGLGEIAVGYGVH